MSAPSKAVFLSYASQDADPARRICEALRAAGVEVWFDQSELRGGDAWDAKIRRQIKECALFMPVISVNTNARPEGYFRLEWKLAVDRSHLMADDQPFLFPILIGEATDATARVPDKFRDVQWTRLRLDETPAELAGRVSDLLHHDPASPRTLASPRTKRGPANRGQRGWRDYWWIIFPIFGMTMAFMPTWRALMSPKREARNPKVVAPAVQVPPTPPPQKEERRLAAKASELVQLLDSTREDFALAEDLLKQAKALNPVDAEVWAAEAQVQTRFLMRGFDRSDARRELATTALQKALRLDPTSFEARLARDQLAMQKPQQLAETERNLRELLAERPTDKRVLRALGTTIGRQGRADEAIVLYDRATALPGGDPLAHYDKAWVLWYDAHRPEQALAEVSALAEKTPFSSALLATGFFLMVLRGDLDAAKATIERIPVAARGEDRTAIVSAAIYTWRREPEAALASLQQLPREWIEDAFFNGPRNLLGADALAAGGRHEAALALYQRALAQTEERLRSHADDRFAQIDRIFLLAVVGEKEKAAQQHVVYEQSLLNPYSASNPMPRPEMRTYLELGRKAELFAHLKSVIEASRRAQAFLSSAALRLDPTWDKVRSDPEFQALIASAESLEKNASK